MGYLTTEAGDLRQIYKKPRSLCLCVCVRVVVTFVGAKLDESTTSSLDEALLRERHIVAEFRRLRDLVGVTDADPQSADMAATLDMELRRLGLDIEIIELRERDSVSSQTSSPSLFCSGKPLCSG